MAEMLRVDNLLVNYGAIKAVKGISFEVNQGEIVTLIGANGAGKTTTLHAVFALERAAGGSIHFCGADITKWKHIKSFVWGLAQVPEGRRIFRRTYRTAESEMGAYTRVDSAAEIQKDYDEIYEWLPRLKERRKQQAGTLSGGEQRDCWQWVVL